MAQISEFVLVFIVLALGILTLWSSGNVHGPGHHKGLYGITKRPKPKAVETNKNSTTNTTNVNYTTSKSSEKAKVDGKASAELKAVKRSIFRAVRSKDSELPKADENRINNEKKRTEVEVLGGVIRPVSVKEMKVGYTKSTEEKVPNTTQVIEITSNMTSSKPEDSMVNSSNALNEGDKSNASDNEARSASSNMITDVSAPRLNPTAGEINESQNTTDAGVDTRTTSTNIITDLKVPDMGKYIHGKEENNNASNVPAAGGTPVNGSQGQDGDNAASRSPQVPNLGASIVGIVDNSNSSQPNQRASLTGEISAMNTSTENGTTQGSDDGVKLKAFLHDLDEIANSTVQTAELVNNTVQETSNLVQNQSLPNGGNSSTVVSKDVNANKKHEIIGPHYYEPECDDKKKCPDGHYCHDYVCVECHRSKHACTHREQCCNNMECVYGRCETKPKGSPGAFCEKDSECAGESCCVLEPTVDEEHSMCKPKLSEYHQCSPILFRKIWIGNIKPDCGPCKGGLECVQRGVEGSHEVCMKKP